MGMLATQNWFSYQRKGGQEDHIRRLTQNVSNAPVRAPRISGPHHHQAERSADAAARRSDHHRAGIHRGCSDPGRGKEQIHGPDTANTAASAPLSSPGSFNNHRMRPPKNRSREKANDPCRQPRGQPPIDSAGRLAPQPISNVQSCRCIAWYFLLPAMVLFEIGTSLHPSDPIAFRMLQLFFHQLGATGRFIPFFFVAGILLIWHIVRKDPWKVRMETLWGMLIESSPARDSPACARNSGGPLEHPRSAIRGYKPLA